MDDKLNIFNHIENGAEIPALVRSLAKNTQSLLDNRILIEAELHLLTSIVEYLYMEAPQEEQNMFMILELLESAKSIDADEVSDYDMLLNHTSATKPDHPALISCSLFKKKSGNNINHVIDSCIARLKAFDDPVKRKEFMQENTSNKSKEVHDNANLDVKVVNSENKVDIVTKSSPASSSSILDVSTDHGKKEVDVIELYDEEGNSVKFEHLDTIIYKNQKYCVLTPLNEYAEVGDEIESDVHIMAAVIDENGEETLEIIEDWNLEDEVFDIFKKRSGPEYEFMDSTPPHPTGTYSIDTLDIITKSKTRIYEALTKVNETFETSHPLPNKVLTKEEAKKLAGPHIVIPEGYTEIDSYVFSGIFSGRKDIVSVTIPNGVLRIGNGAFHMCGRLENVFVPDSVTNIGEYTFAWCKKLTNIILPNKIKSIESNTFYSCENLMNVTIPDGVTNIGDDAFSFCRKLSSVTIPDSVTNIGRSAFNSCNDLIIFCSKDSFSHEYCLKNKIETKIREMH